MVPVFARGVAITPDPNDEITMNTLHVLGHLNDTLQTTRALGPGPVTVATTVQVEENWQTEGTEAIWLAGFVPEGGEQLQGVVWAEETSGWFTMWKIQLRIDGHAPIELAAVTPKKGGIYDTYLSYDPVHSAISWLVVDRTDGTVVTNGGRNGSFTVDGSMVLAGIRLRRQQEAGVHVDALRVYGEYVPVAARVQLVTVNEARIPKLKFTRDEDVYIRLLTPGGGVEGQFHVRLQDQDTGRIHTMAPLSPEGQETLVPFPLDVLQPGRTTLLVRYEQDGHTWLVETLQLSIGRLTAGYERPEYDRQTRQISTGIRIESDARIDDLPVTVSVTMSRQVWDQRTRTYVSSPQAPETIFSSYVSVDREQLVVPVTVDVPEPEQPGLWQIDFAMETGRSLELDQFRTSHLFTNYPPSSSTDETFPFTIAVLPDTQYYARDYPDIFVRQTEWLVANAEERNIRLMLHLGDITDRNTHAEWERANRSISLLDGVIPYVLATGNHDLLSGAGVRDRTSTHFNMYFPASRYQDLPSFGGLFEADRHENSYYTFNLGGEAYLVMSLEFGPRDEVLDWANHIVAEHPDHKVVVITHTYTSSSGRRVTPNTTSASPQVYPLGQDPKQSVNDGEQMWDKFVRRHPNMFMVLSGHIATSTMRSQVAVGDHGNTVYEILMDYQGEPNGGDGWLVLLEFVDENTLEVRTYSPYRDEWENQKSVNGFTNRFNMDLQRGSLVLRWD